MSVVKGRIVGKLYNIDKEIGSYSRRISKLESELKDRQAELYKKYSNMEIAMQNPTARAISARILRSGRSIRRSTCCGGFSRIIPAIAI